ncbi:MULTISPECIES: DUF4239 domain-containing protein [Kitasatospora]|uniref:DUF4239 domain-containing protein n=1 Tax=Kitasatospora setae (strain ATCC 33774 / DSM 43861 / JCM 3304 / KCC A-0304 / NBRC 14216 / KM-6054) TaxID=452652 RepID=E4N4I4_KITSK|nr:MULTISPECIES: DUF4239 domain-containing protein [Kitasatospora]BAJ26115.1 hypothetical protein KSE_02680 [Kitasatospora setae KM-6054]
MILWLLNNFDTLTLTIVIVGGIMIVAVAGAMLVRRKFPQISEGGHNEMIGNVLGMFGAIYGIILAFVIVALWTQLDTANTIVASESTAAASIVRDADGFAPAEGARVKAAVGAYVHGVVEVQWPLMHDGSPDYEATAPLVREIYAALQSYEPRNSSEQSFYDSAVGSLDDLVQQRRARITMATQQLPLLLQTLVYGGALVLIPMTFLFGVRSKRMQALFVGSVAALIGFSLLLTLVLDRPFSGDLSVSPKPFKEGALSQFWK